MDNYRIETVVPCLIRKVHFRSVIIEGYPLKKSSVSSHHYVAVVKSINNERAVGACKFGVDQGRGLTIAYGNRRTLIDGGKIVLNIDIKLARELNPKLC